MAAQSEVKYKPITFFIITFSLTWGFWFLTELFIQNKNAETIFLLLGLLAPFATALVLILSSENRELREIFFNKLLNIRLIHLASVPAIVLIPPISIIISILISIFFGFPADQFRIAQSFSFHIGTMPTLLYTATLNIGHGFAL